MSRRPPLARLFALTAAVVVALPVAAAQANEPWPAGTEAVVQGGVADLQPDVANETTTPPGTRLLLAHGYGHKPIESDGFNSTGGATLKVRYAEAVDGTAGIERAVTGIDFDRDGRPDLLSVIELRFDNQSGGSSETSARVYDVRGLPSTTNTCVRVPTAPERRLLDLGDVPGREPANNMTVFELTLRTLGEGTTPVIEPGLLRYAPRIITMIAGENASDAGLTPMAAADLVMPAAGRSADASCTGGGAFPMAFAGATDRYPAGAAPTAEVRHADPAGDVSASGADLTAVTLQRRAVTVSRVDDADATDHSGTRTLQPSDLTLDFASGSGLATITYLWKRTWNRGGSPAPSLPDAVVRTEPGVDPGTVKVLLYRGLPATATGSGDTKQCLRAEPKLGADLTLTLPLAALGGGERRARIVLDSMLDSVRGPSTTAGVADYRFHTISDPGPGAGGAIDHVPTMAGFSQTGSDVATGCETAGERGAEVYLHRSLRSVAPPALTFSASPSSVERGSPVTFTIGGDAGERYCWFTQAFTREDCSSITTKSETYTQNTTAYATLDLSDGRWTAEEQLIRIVNARPVAVVGLGTGGPPAGSDGSYAIVQNAPVSVPLVADVTDADSTSFTYEWKLDGSVAATTATYTPTFTAPGSHVVTLTVTDDSGDPSTATSDAATRTIDVVRSPQNEVSIVRPLRVIGGQPFDIEAELEQTSGYAGLSWQWDFDGDATADFDPAHSSRALTGIVIADPAPAHLVRVRATDAGGRAGDATIELNVRAANEAPPVGEFAFAPATVQSGEPVTFDASASQLSDIDGSLLGPVGQNPADVKFRWDFGDGSPVVETSTASIDHTFAGSGKVTVSVVVLDQRAAPATLSDPEEQQITVRPGATDANAPAVSLERQGHAADAPVFAKRDITLTAGASRAAAGHAPLTFAFDLDGDGTFERAGGTEPSVTFSPARPGPLTVSVKATDIYGSSATASLTFDVKEEPAKAPTAMIQGPAELTLTGVAARATYDATGSQGNNLDPAVTFRWDLDGDGSFETPTATTPQVTASFNTAGPKRIGLRVSDTYGNSADVEMTTIVRSPADVAAGCKGAASLRDVTFRLVRLRGCAETIKRPSAGDLHILSGRITLAGLQVTRGSGARPGPIGFADCGASDCQRALTTFNGAADELMLALDTADGTLRSNHRTVIRAVGSGVNIPVYSGNLNFVLPQYPQDGITIGVPSEAALFGFPATGTANLKFPGEGEALLTLTVGLPAAAGGFTGEAAIRSTATGGVVLDELRIEVGDIKISKLEMGKLFFVYSRPDDLWEGGGAMKLPTPRPLTISAELAIQNNKFKRIWAEVSGINQPIAQAIYLQALRAGVAVDPLDLTGGITVSAGPAVQNKSVLALDGDVRLRFPSPAANYYLFALTGRLRLADFQLATGFAQFSSNGFFEMGGGIDVDFEIAYLQAMVSGWITANAFNIDGNAEVGLKINGKRYGLVGAKATISTTGFGACGEIPVLDLGGGFGGRWGSSVKSFWGCDLSPYRAARPADAPASPLASLRRAIQLRDVAPRTDLRRGRLLIAGPRGHRLQMPARREKALITVKGRGGEPPRVTIIDSRGKVRLSTPADGSDALTKRMLVRSDAETGTTQILWKAPPSGRLYVLEQLGSAKVAGVDMALPAPKRRITARVTGSGAKRTLAWSITPALHRGQTVQLAEEGAEAGAELISTARSKGSLRFAPQGGRAGTRKLTATIITEGMPGEKIVAGSFTAPPPPAPAAPRGLRITRSSSGAMVRWTPGRGARVKTARHEVTIRTGLGEGRKKLIVVPAGRNGVRIGDVNPGDKLSATVVSADRTGITSRPSRALLRAGLRASSGKGASITTTKPRDVRVKRLSGKRLQVRWRTGGAFLRGFSVRVTTPDGKVHLLRTAGNKRSVVFEKIARGKLRISVIGRRYQGVVTRKDVRYVDRRGSEVPRPSASSQRPR